MGTEEKGWLSRENALIVLAMLGVLASLQIYANRNDLEHPWLTMGTTAIAIGGCVAGLRRDRESLDVLFLCLGALSTLFALAMFGGDPTQTIWWAWFLGFTGAAATFVLLSRNRAAVLIGITAIVGVRLVIALLRS